MEAGQDDIQSMRSVVNYFRTLFPLQTVFDLLFIFLPLAAQKYLRSCVCSKNDKPQGQVSRTYRRKAITILL